VGAGADHLVGARPTRRARGLIIVLACALGMVAAACSGEDAAPAPETTTTAAPETTTTTEPPLEAGTQHQPLYFVPTVGLCFDRRKVPGPDNKQVDVILEVGCELLHQYEIFAIVDYPLPEDGDTTWPGDEAVRNVARAQCPATFDEYIGKAYETSELEIGHLLPPEDNFAVNQTIGCYVYDPGQVTMVEGERVQGRTAGTARGVAR
jgi:hypothetical protein